MKTEPVLTHTVAELLIVVDEDGKLSGSHVKPRVKKMIGDYVVSNDIANPIPLRCFAGHEPNTGTPEAVLNLWDVIKEMGVGNAIELENEQNAHWCTKQALEQITVEKSLAQKEATDALSLAGEWKDRYESLAMALQSSVAEVVSDSK